MTESTAPLHFADDDQAPKPGFKPLLIGLGPMLASVACMLLRRSLLGSSLVDANAQGTYAITVAIAMAVVGLCLDYAHRHREGRLSLGVTMGLATVFLIAQAALVWLFLSSGGQLSGVVPGIEFAELVLAGLLAGAGLALTFSGWHTCALGTSVQGFIWFVVSFVIAFVLVDLLATLGLDLLATCGVAAAYALVGAALLHVQERVISNRDRF